MAMFDRTALGFFVPESEFKPADIPDLSGKVAIVTGGNVSFGISLSRLKTDFVQTGLGKLTAQHLLEHNAKVYVACRSEEKAAKAIEDIKKATGKSDIQ